jgi:ABC-2 type transport system ATP-binding protein
VDAPAIVTEALSKRYGRQRGILDLDLEVRPGEIFGYLGPNGAGKTTTIRLLLDLIRPTSGSASMLGLDSHHDSLAIRRRVGYLPGELSLYGNLTGAETLRYMGNLRGGLDWTYVQDLAKRLDCDLTRPIHALSSGNRQKVGLIQAFMHRPELLIMDEPTRDLDPLVQQVFHQMVLEAKQEGRTVFLSSHVLPEVERVCDRVGILREGRLVAVEEITTLKGRALRRLEVRFASPVPREAFSSLAGMRDLRVEGPVLHCTVQGPLDPLVKALARFPVLELDSREASPRASYPC